MASVLFGKTGKQRILLQRFNSIDRTKRGVGKHLRHDGRRLVNAGNDDLFRRNSERPANSSLAGRAYFKASNLIFELFRQKEIGFYSVA